MPWPTPPGGPVAMAWRGRSRTMLEQNAMRSATLKTSSGDVRDAAPASGAAADAEGPPGEPGGPTVVMVTQRTDGTDASACTGISRRSCVT